MGKLALLFPGQGAQYVGMGLDFPNHKDVLNQVKSLTNVDIETAISTGEGLNETRFTQLSVFTASRLAFDALMSLKPTFEGMTGFSLGEYSGLYAANVLSFDTAVDLIYQRAIAMHEATLQTKGFMAAVLGLDAKAIENGLKQVQTGVVVCANYNSPIQTVISGEASALPETEAVLKGLGAKRVIPLSVSGAFHSPLMKEAAIKFEKTLNQVTLNKPLFPLYLNTTALVANPDTLKTEMVKQIYQSVLFQQTIEHMIEDGFTHFLEVGPGQVLGPLVKKINPNVESFSFGKYTELDNLKGWLITHGFIQ